MVTTLTHASATRQVQDITANGSGARAQASTLSNNGQGTIGSSTERPNVPAAPTELGHQEPEQRASDIVTLNASHLAPAPQPEEARRLNGFRALRKWRGYVVEVFNDSFVAHLVPIEGDGQEKVAKIRRNVVNRHDQSLLEPGASFYWSIGHWILPNGDTQRASILRFRRLPGWTEQQLRHAAKRAEVRTAELRALFADD